MTTRRTTLKTLGAFASLATSPYALAQDSATMRLLVGFAPGGPVDLTARMLADELKGSLSRTVLVDNKPGAGQRIALRDLRGAAPDGGTIMIATNSPFTVYPHIYVKLDYDPVKDFTPIAAVATFDQGIATGPMTGAQNVKELISWINANKSRAVYGTPGAGTLPHFLGIAFSRATGLQMNPVHYKGGSPPMADLAGGHLPVLCNGLSDMLEMHRAGKVRVLAVASAQRSPVLPDVPTLKEVGVDLTMSVTAGIFGPPGMSASVLSRMEAAIAQARTRDSVRERMARIGLTASTLNSAQFTAALAEESARLQVLVKASGYQPE
jgi:tripartite-type tricarboxylate transporter receptor subunit TctC